MAEKKTKEVTGVQTKEEIIAAMRSKLDKDFGKGTLMGAKDKPSYHTYVSTGSVGLDKALGIGGIPRGRIIEIYGPESSGKTTLAIHIMAEAQKKPGTYCCIIDAEHAFDTQYAKSLGVNEDFLHISQPNNGEEALEVTHRVVETGAYDVVVVDSVAALVPKGELEADMGSAVMGSQARLMSQALRKLVATTGRTGTILIFINQLREKIGVMFGNPETTTGGNALKFYASVRLDIRRKSTDKEAIKEGEVRVGNPVTVKVIKNKVAPPFRKADFDVLYGEGIDKYGEVLDEAVEMGIVVKSGTFFSYEGTSIGQGRNNAVHLLRDNPDLYEEMRHKVIESFLPKELPASEIKQIQLEQIKVNEDTTITS